MRYQLRFVQRGMQVLHLETEVMSKFHTVNPTGYNVLLGPGPMQASGRSWDITCPAFRYLEFFTACTPASRRL